MPLSSTGFVERLHKSGLLSAREIAALDRSADEQSLAGSLVKQGWLTKFQAVSLLGGHSVVLDNYELLSLLGEGGMGKVFRARHRRMKREVALKVLPKGAGASRGQIERFQREVEAAARLSHPNIVITHDAREAKGQQILVMELIEGSDLDAHVKQHGSLSASHAVAYAAQAAAGLAYAHSKGVIHRDIKPANLLLSTEGVVKILDMGIARLGVDDASLTATGQLMGTAHFMSPEQAMDAKHVGPAADVYSLGCTLWWLLVGRPPFPGQTLMQVLWAHREMPPPSLTEAAGVPDELDDLFRRMVAKEAHERPAMADVLAELRGLVHGGTIGAAESRRRVPQPHSSQVVPAAVSTVGDRATAATRGGEAAPWRSGRKTGLRRRVLLAVAAGLALTVLISAALGVVYQHSLRQFAAGGDDQAAPRPRASEGDSDLEELQDLSPPAVAAPADSSQARTAWQNESADLPDAAREEIGRRAEEKWSEGLAAESAGDHAAAALAFARAAGLYERADAAAAQWKLDAAELARAARAADDARLAYESAARKLPADERPAEAKEAQSQSAEAERLADQADLSPAIVARRTEVQLWQAALEKANAALTSQRLTLAEEAEEARQGATAAVALAEQVEMELEAAVSTAKAELGRVQREKRYTEFAAAGWAVRDAEKLLDDFRSRTDVADSLRDAQTALAEAISDDPALARDKALEAQAEADKVNQYRRYLESKLARERAELPVEIETSLGANMVLIPPGTFEMGSPTTERGRNDDETRHTVRITQPYYIGVHEVTVGEFGAFVNESKYETEAETDGEGGWGWNDETGKLEGRDVKYNWRSTGFTQTDRHPVVNVTWNDARAFCDWLSRQEGREYRLLTEAEWEYACRAGTTTAWYSGDDQLALAEVGNVADASAKAKWTNYQFFIYLEADDGHVFTAPGGSYRPNVFGLYDMHGNVWEWCSDWYDGEYYDNSPGDDPPGPTGASRVLRGGSWYDYPWLTRSAKRNRSAPSDRNYLHGFRLARTTP